jgi:hypothetical protein
MMGHRGQRTTTALLANTSLGDRSKAKKKDTMNGDTMIDQRSKRKFEQ